MLVENIEKYESGRYLQVDAQSLLTSLDIVQARRLRNQINTTRKDNQPVPIRCGLCKEPLYLKRNPSEFEGYHFSHYKTEDLRLNKCPQRSENSIPADVMRAIKYQGAKESERHFRLKNKIANLLLSDPRVPDETVKIESVLKAEGEWRKPDVQALIRKKLIAFEVQVSTEMAPMIAAREYFYERFGNIIWILPSFDPDRINQSQIDILTSNNNHLFVLSDKARINSEERSELTLEVWVYWPKIENNTLVWEWKSGEYNIHEINFGDGHPFVIDVFLEEKKIRGVLEEVKSKPTIDSISVKDDKQEYIKCTNWWRDWVSFCNEIVDPYNFEIMHKHFISGDEWSSSCTTLKGLWLSLYGVNLEKCKYTDFVIKALICASKGELSYGYTSWKYVSNELIRNHISWFSPFFKLLKTNLDKKDFDKFRGDKRISEVVKKLREKPIFLSSDQKKLLWLIDPRLNSIQVEALYIEAPSQNKFKFLYSDDSNLNETSLVVPSDMMTFLRLTDSGRYQEHAYDDRSNSAFKALQRMNEIGVNIPFPNIPLDNPSGEYFLSYEDADEFIPIWHEQLNSLKKEYTSIS